MTQFYKRIIFIIILATFVQLLFAQPGRLQFIHKTQEDGLSSSSVSAIIQDYKGFMWFGTPDGLNRYDGYNYVIYKNNPFDSSSLINNVVITIFEDHKNNFLLGTENGLSLYNRNQKSFLNYMFDKSSPLNGLRCSVLKITEDTIGNLWLATNVGLIYFDRTRNQMHIYNHDPANPESLSSDYVEGVMIDKNNNLWVTTRKGLNRYISRTSEFEHITTSCTGEDLTNTIFTDLIEDREGNLWFASEDGLFCMKNNGKSFNNNCVHYKHDSKDDSSLTIDQVISLFVDNAGNLWVGTENGGINLFNKEKNSFSHYRRDDYDMHSLSTESIDDIYQDRTGNLWFGTYTGGLNIVVKNSNAINSFQNQPGASFSLSHNTVTCFLEGQKGSVWIGTDGGGLNLFDSQRNHFTRFNTRNCNIGSNAILCLAETSGHQIWFGTWAGGLVRFDPETNAFRSFTNKNSGNTDNNIFSVAEGDDNDLWLGSFEHGLLHYQIRENKFTEYNQTNSGLGNEMVVKIVKLPGKRLLIGTSTGFQIYYISEDRFANFAIDPKKSDCLSYDRVTDILVENDTSIWIGTPYGLNHFNPNTGLFKKFFKKDGLPDDFIRGLAIDKSSDLWVTTNKGVSRYHRATGQFKNFTKADGLQGNEFSERSILKLTDGSVLMGGTKGFNIIYPEKIVENTKVPDIVITDFKIFNKSVNPGDENSPLKQNISETKFLSLTHENSVLSFSFAVMDFTAPEKNQFAYKMEGFDEDWFYSGNKSEAIYTNLSPGDYTFRVKGSNNDGVWNEEGTSIRILILPPWWSTVWFRLIIISVVILLFTAILFSRFRQLKNQKLLLEKTVALKTAELFELNASKDKFFSIIAHDLKNPFNTIVGFSNMLKEDAGSGELGRIDELTALINDSATRTYHLLENLLDWANSQRNMISFIPVSINLTEILQEEFNLVDDLLKAKQINLSSHLDAPLMIMADRNMIRTVVRNLITNAVKFTNRMGAIEVNAVIVNDNVEIAVSDNGIGMTDETMGKLFRIDANLSTRGTGNEEGTGLGLFLCKEFVERHGGRIWVESREGKGSTFRFTLPVKFKNTD